MPEMAHPAVAQAHCPNQAPGWPCKTCWSSLLKNESHAIGGTALSSQWKMWASARGVPSLHIYRVSCLLFWRECVCANTCCPTTLSCAAVLAAERRRGRGATQRLLHMRYQQMQYAHHISQSACSSPSRFAVEPCIHNPAIGASPLSAHCHWRRCKILAKQQLRAAVP